MSSDNCHICLQPGHGFHFGVFICRACAAFFRRCHFSPRLYLKKCRVTTGKCEPRNGKWLCKKCRLQKCLSLGMTTDNIQYDRDTHMSSETFLANREVSRAQNAPLVHFDQRKDAVIAFVDMSALVEKAVNYIMSPNMVKIPKSSSTLEQLADALSHYQSSQKSTLSEIAYITRNHQATEWKRKMLSAATWLNSSAKFRSLEEEIKLNILRGAWMLWGKLERVAMTARMRKKGHCEKNQFVVSNNSMVDFGRISNDVSWRSTFSYEQLLFLLEPSERYYDSLISEIMEVQPDYMELAFLICIICFQATGAHFRGDTEKECEKLQEEVANDLHNYYASREKSMYAFRIQQLLRVKELFFRLRFQRGEKYRVACQLDCIQLKVSNPEFFKLMC